MILIIQLIFEKLFHEFVYGIVIELILPSFVLIFIFISITT